MPIRGSAKYKKKQVNQKRRVPGKFRVNAYDGAKNRNFPIADDGAHNSDGGGKHNSCATDFYRERGRLREHWDDLLYKFNVHFF